MLCDGLTGADLDALIAQLRAAYLDVISGEGIGQVWGEGRKIHYTGANVDDLRAELKAAQREKQRQDPNYDCGGNALYVEL